MDKAQHTPGPWVVKPSVWLGGTAHSEGPGIFSIEGARTETVICDRRTHWPEQADVMAANARLIAAAPELLEAPQELADCGAEAWGEERPCVREARAAIARATEAQS